MAKGRTDRKKLVKALDVAFSKWVRMSNADHAGYTDCYTCGVTKHYSKMDAGHFQTRAKYSTRWDEQNVKPQCKHCNMTNGGHQYEFAMHLDKEFGKGTADKVVERGHRLRRFSNEELKEMIARYRALVAKL